MNTERGTNFRNYVLGFLVFSFSAALSFFIGFKLGKDVAREEFRKEVLRTKETELEDVLQKIFERAETMMHEEQNQSEEKEITPQEDLQEETQATKKEKMITTEENEMGENGNTAPEEKKVLETRGKEAQTQNPPQGQLPPRGRLPQSLRNKNLWESDGRWTVQIASFENYKKASRYAEDIKRKYGLPTYIVRATKNDKVVWRVRVGKTRNRNTAEEIRSFLKSEGIDGIVTF